MIFARINLNIPFPPAYSRKRWDFSNDIDYIKRSLLSVDWTGILKCYRSGKFSYVYLATLCLINYYDQRKGCSVDDGLDKENPL